MQFHESVLDEGNGYTRGYEREKLSASEGGTKSAKGGFRYKPARKIVYCSEEEAERPKFYKGSSIFLSYFRSYSLYNIEK